MLCRDQLRDKWVMMWKKSSMFSGLTPLMEHVSLWVFQAMLLAFALLMQWRIIASANTRIHSIKVWAGDWIDRMAVVYSDVMPSSVSGWVGGGENKFELGPGEYLVKIGGIRTDKEGILFSMWLETNTGRMEKYGSKKAPWDGVSEFSYQCEPGDEIYSVQVTAQAAPWYPVASALTIERVAMRKHEEVASGGSSEAAALDLASM